MVVPVVAVLSRCFRDVIRESFTRMRGDFRRVSVVARSR